MKKVKEDTMVHMIAMVGDLQYVVVKTEDGKYEVVGAEHAADGSDVSYGIYESLDAARDSLNPNKNDDGTLAPQPDIQVNEISKTHVEITFSFAGMSEVFTAKQDSIDKLVYVNSISPFNGELVKTGIAKDMEGAYELILDRIGSYFEGAEERRRELKKLH